MKFANLYFLENSLGGRTVGLENCFSNFIFSIAYVRIGIIVVFVNSFSELWFCYF